MGDELASSRRSLTAAVATSACRSTGLPGVRFTTSALLTDRLQGRRYSSLRDDGASTTVSGSENRCLSQRVRAEYMVHWFGTNTDVESERQAAEANAELREREQLARHEAELQSDSSTPCSCKHPR